MLNTGIAVTFPHSQETGLLAKCVQLNFKNVSSFPSAALDSQIFPSLA